MSAEVMYDGRRAAVKPKTSILDLRIEDHDCSDSSFSGFIPLDGQWVITSADTNGVRIAKAGLAGGTDVWQHANINEATLAAALVDGPGLAMVWTSGSTRADVQQLGGKAVPVLKGQYKCVTKQFYIPNTSAALTHADNGYVPNVMLTVMKCTTDDGAERLFLRPILAASKSGVAVAKLIRVTNSSLVPGQGEIEIEVFAAPQIITRAVA